MIRNLKAALALGAFALVPAALLAQTPVLGGAYVDADVYDEVLVRFSTAPGAAGETTPANWTVAGTTVTSVIDEGGSVYRLSLDDELTRTLLSPVALSFDNGTDPASETIHFYPGIITLEEIRNAVDPTAESVDSATTGITDIDDDPNAFVTVQGIVIENRVSTGGNRNIFIQQGDFGIVCRSNSGANTIALDVDLGDEIIFAGMVSEFNGLLQIQGRSGLGINIVDTVSVGNTLPEPTIIEVGDIDTDDPYLTFEALESTRVTLRGVTFANAGGTFGTSPNNQNFDEFGPGVITSRFDGGSLATFGGETIPSGPQDVTGVLSQFNFSAPFDGFYQVFPAEASDIAPAPPADLHGAGLDSLPVKRIKP